MNTLLIVAVLQVLTLLLIFYLHVCKKREGAQLAVPRRLIWGSVPIDARSVMTQPGDEQGPLIGPTDDEIMIPKYATTNMKLSRE